MRRTVGADARPWSDAQRTAATAGQRQLIERLARMRRRSAFLGMAVTWALFVMVAVAVLAAPILPTGWLWIPIGFSLALKAFWCLALARWPTVPGDAQEAALAAARREVVGRLHPVANAINLRRRLHGLRSGRIAVDDGAAVELMGALLWASRGFPFALRPPARLPGTPAVADLVRGARSDAVVVAILVAAAGVVVPLLTDSVMVVLFAALGADLLSYVWLAERRLTAIAALVGWQVEEASLPPLRR